MPTKKLKLQKVIKGKSHIFVFNFKSLSGHFVTKVNWGVRNPNKIIGFLTANMTYSISSNIFHLSASYQKYDTMLVIR